MVKTIFLFFIAIGFLSFPVFYCGAQLYQDIQTPAWDLAPELEVKSANCTRWHLVVATCSVEYVNVFDRSRVQPRLHYFMFMSWAGERVMLARSKSAPSHVTITLGIEHMVDRELTLAIYTVLAVALLIAMGRGAARHLAWVRNQPKHGNRASN